MVTDTTVLTDQHLREEMLKSSSMRIIFLSHGEMASTLVRTVDRILDKESCVEPWDLDWNTDKNTIRERIHLLENELGEDEELLLITDMPGNTPTNVAREFCDPGRVEVVCGANLPMLLRISCRPCCDRNVGELAVWIAEKGRCAIVKLDSRGGDACEGEE